MEFITVQGKRIPSLGFGTWRLEGRTCTEAVLSALKIGYRHIDTAQIYGNETEVGGAINASRIPRKDIFLTTKVWMDRVADGALQRSVDESLRKLRTDYVDLLLIHWPVPEVPLKEQLKALGEVQKDGRAKLIGVSNFTTAMLSEATGELGAPLANNQIEYHPYLSQKPVLDFARAHDMFVTAYSPLARGKIAGQPVLEAIAKTRGKTAGQITLRWLVQQGNVAAIPKAASEAHMEENFDIFDFTLSDDEMTKIHALARPDGRMINPDWSPAWDSAA